MNKKGFTLVELMVVIVIIGVLAAVAIPKMMAATNKAKAGEGPQILSAISRMEASHKAENDVYVAAPAPTAAGKAVANDGWYELGFDQKPFSRYFSFEVAATTPADGFTATATLTATLGDAKATTDKLTINEQDVRTATAPLKSLVPNWEPKTTTAP